MATWTNKTDHVDTYAAADVNQLASGFGSTYNFGTHTTVKQLSDFHTATGSHVGQIHYDDLIDGAVGTTKLAANAVTNAKLAGMVRGTIKVGNASGAASDLALGAAARLLQSDGADPAWVAVSGDATIASGGALTIANDAVNNNKLANITRGSIKVGGVADAPTDLAIGFAAKLLQSDGTDPGWVAMSGDATIAVGGALSIGSSKITKAMMGADVLSGYGATGARPAAAKSGWVYFNTTTQNIERDNGATYDTLAGMLSSANRDDLTDGGITTLHQHQQKDVLYSDQTYAASGAAAALPEYQYADPGSNSSQTKIRTVYDHEATVNFITLLCQAQVDADPTPATADIQVYISDGGVDTASQIYHIVSYGSWVKASVQVDVSSLNTGLHWIEVRLVWTSSSPSGKTAKMRWCRIDRIGETG